ncbi:tyrosine-type recombinase/integrase [Roseovarius salinarum]|uniref:tyrosine-type recombinase/integrase n=1 Tax=Roseovarius salinarum TaxID=1981892 RepID=UPI000C335FA5|nr:tyrosine-type recombinase/integrase [Roseovarius salinarum]
MPDLSNKTARRKLKPRSSAYTQKLAEGRALGYRKRTAGAPGRWLLRTAEDEGGYAFEVLGAADDHAEADGREVLSYTQALAAALGKQTADPTKITVAQALDEWARAKVATASTEKRKADIESTARRIAAAFKRKTLKTITARDIARWMDGYIVEGKDPRARRATANRDLATLKAALTRAANAYDYTGPRAWEAAKKFAKAESFGARMVILTLEQEAQLIAAARSDFADVLTALQMTGARYGEIRHATAGDLQGNRLTLEGKTGRRTIALSPDKAAWFAERAKGRPKGAPLLIRHDGTGWPDGGQMKPMRAAVAAAGLPETVTTYALRHGFISRALSAGVPIAAVAQHVGSSPEMIAASYAKFTPTQMQEWFA